MIIRTIRDIFTGDVDTIYIDEPAAFERAKEFLQIVMPHYVDRLQLYEGKEPLFHRYRIDEEIGRIQRRDVPLRQGGSIVIDQTEALVAIDVNSGNFRADDSAEETAYQMNLRAANEIARQLRLRDLGGVIVNDFIDMREERHRRGVERALRDAIKRDRARTKILRTSPFGLIEMTRQTHSPQPETHRLQGLPDARAPGWSRRPRAWPSTSCHPDPGQPARGRRQGGRHRFGRSFHVPEQQETPRDWPVSRTIPAFRCRFTGARRCPPEHLVVECFDTSGRDVKFRADDPRPGPTAPVNYRAQDFGRLQISRVTQPAEC